MLFTLLCILSFISQPAQGLKAGIDSFLKDKLTGYESFEYTILSAPSDYKKIVLKTGRTLNRNGEFAYLPVLVTFKNNRTVKNFITLKLKLYKKIPVTIKQIDRKETLEASDFLSELVNVAGLQGEPVTSVENINKFRSRIYLKAGEVLLKEMIEPVPLIYAGDKIRLNSVYGNVTVTMDAISKQDGSAGDKILVATPGNKQFRAKVIDPKNAIIAE